MDKKIIFFLISFIILTFFISEISASNIVSGTYSVGSYSLGLSSSSSKAFNAIYNASPGFSPITTNFASGIAGGIIFATPATTSVVVSNLPLPQGNIASQTSQQYLWALTLNPGSTSILNFSNPNFGFNSSISLSEMDINVNTAQSTNLLITQFYNPPSEILPMSGQIYQYLEIEFSNPLNSGNVNLIFKVNKTWISQNNINSSNISICKLDNLTNNAWIILNTTYQGADGNFDYYQANINSFSYFAIGNIINTSIISQTPLIQNNNTQISTYSASKNQNLVWLFILIAFILAIVICLIISKKRKIKRIINGKRYQKKSRIKKLKRKETIL